jgi:hypothetical protein
MGGKQLLNVVVENDEVAARCIEHLQRTKTGALPLGSPEAPCATVGFVFHVLWALDAL